jgi:hypothetical protein
LFATVQDSGRILEDVPVSLGEKEIYNAKNFKLKRVVKDTGIGDCERQNPEVVLRCGAEKRVSLKLVDQGVTKRCRLSSLTNSALVKRVQMRGVGGSCGVSANGYICAMCTSRDVESK